MRTELPTERLHRRLGTESEPDTDTDAAGTGESITVGRDPKSELHDETAPDRVVGEGEAGLGRGLDEAEEARRKKP